MACAFRDVHLQIHSTIDALDLVQTVTEHIARQLGEEDDSLHWTAMAVRESVINAITHGNRDDPTKLVYIDYTASAHDEAVDFIVRVRDQGSGFDPGRVSDPLTPENIFKTGGRGIFLIKQFMDEVSLERDGNGGMEVRMRKRIKTK